MYLFADNKHYKAKAAARRTLARVSVRASESSEFHPKKAFDTGTCVYFIPFNLPPAPEYSRTTLKNPIDKPVLKSKWTLEKNSNFYSGFTYWGISQLTIYRTNISI